MNKPNFAHFPIRFCFFLSSSSCFTWISLGLFAHAVDIYSKVHSDANVANNAGNGMQMTDRSHHFIEIFASAQQTEASRNTPKVIFE